LANNFCSQRGSSDKDGGAGLPVEPHRTTSKCRPESSLAREPSMTALPISNPKEGQNEQITVSNRPKHRGRNET